MSATINRIGPITADWLNTLASCMKTVGVEQYDDCELVYIWQRWREGASAYAVSAELWGTLEGHGDGQ